MPSNNLAGTLPAELGNLAELTLLGFFDNQLSGNLPVFISNCTKLTALALDYNNFDGTIPIEYASLTAMESLYFSGNNLTGDVTNVYASMPNLERLFLDENTFEDTLDLSANENIRLVFLMDNNLSKLDLRNGNNIGIETRRVQNNPNLTCIFVDDKNNIPANWHKDPTATYVETQAECDVLDTEDFKETRFSVYPNPTSKFLNFETNSDVKIIQTTIINITGKVVHTSKSKRQIDVSNLNNGIYFLKIKTNQGITIKKFIKE